jgi:hypothetical protein
VSVSTRLQADLCVHVPGGGDGARSHRMLWSWFDAKLLNSRMPRICYDGLQSAIAIK